VLFIAALFHISSIATRRKAAQSVTPCGTNREAAAEPLDHDLESLAAALPSDPGDDSKANSLSSSPVFLVDNRCFGPVGECQIIGVARPLPTWNPPD